MFRKSVIIKVRFHQNRVLHFLCRTLSARVQKEHPLLTTQPPAKSAQLLCSNSTEFVLNCVRTKVKHRCARTHKCFPSCSGSKTECAYKVIPCVCVYTPRSLLRAHIFADVHVLFSNFCVQFVVVRLSVSTGTYIFSVQCAAKCSNVLHTEGNAP